MSLGAEFDEAEQAFGGVLFGGCSGKLLQLGKFKAAVYSVDKTNPSAIELHILMANNPQSSELVLCC